MAKKGLGVKGGGSVADLTVSARLPEDHLRRIKLSLLRSGLGPKKRSEWFRRAVLALYEDANKSPDDFISSLSLYENTEPGPPTPIYLKGDSARAFLELERRAGVGLADKSAVRTRLALMAADLGIFRDGTADIPTIE